MKGTWIFNNAPLITAGGAVGGKDEKNGPLAAYFDSFFADDVTQANSYEEAEGFFLSRAAQIALNKASLSSGDIDLFIAGDLMNQITSATYTAAYLNAPYLGIFSACATVCEALAMGGLAVSSGKCQKVLVGSVSHNKSAERQFRYPNEYGSQKPPTCQKTATAAGALLLADKGQGIMLESVTVGRVVDYGINDPLNMGAAMAPAAADTICKHFSQTKTSPADYDLILSGDLGKMGRELLFDLLSSQGYGPGKQRLKDCGLLLYGEQKDAFCGGSGAGCIASVLAGYLCNLLQNRVVTRILVAATGALLSPNWVKQGNTIPCISHAVSLRVGDNNA